MDKSAKICIYGAGAIGCTLAANLIRAGFNHVTLIARARHKTQLKQNGIHLTDLNGHCHVEPFDVVDCATELNVQDYIFICTKADAIKDIVDSLHTLLHEDSVIVPMINGVPFWYFYNGEEDIPTKALKSLDPTGYLKQNFPFKHLIGAVVFITAELIEDGQVKTTNPYLIIFGEPSHSISERLSTLSTLFEHTAVEVRLDAQIRDQIWTKVLANLSSNPLSVVTGATLKEIYSHPELKAITQRLLDEIRLLASSYGARIVIDPLQFMHLGSEMGEIHTSMWYDYQQKKPLELSSIAEAALEMANDLGIPMPMTEKIIGLTRFLNEKNLTT